MNKSLPNTSVNATSSARAPLFDTISTGLPRLTKAQLKQIQARVNTLLGSGADGDVGRFYPAFVALFPKSERVPPVSVLVSKAKSFRTDALDLEAFVRRRFVPAQPALHRRGVGLVLAALMDMVGDEGHPITPITVARHLGRYREAVEAAYPGYAESGMLPLLLKYDGAKR